MPGPGYEFFKSIVAVMRIRFCSVDRCRHACQAEGPEDALCPYHAKWVAFYDDLDQLVSGVDEIKEAV